MNTKIKVVNISLIIAAIVTLFFFTSNTAVAQPLDLIGSSDSISELLGSEADNAGTCVLATVISSLDVLAECGDDPTCRAAVVFDMVTDILLCTNPGDENITQFVCLANAIIEMIEASNACDGDRACLIQSMIPVIVDIISCQGE